MSYKYPEEEISTGVAEEALQYGIFEIFDVPFPPPENPKFKFIDLFAGIGGFRIALQNLVYIAANGIKKQSVPIKPILEKFHLGTSQKNRQKVISPTISISCVQVSPVKLFR